MISFGEKNDFQHMRRTRSFVLEVETPKEGKRTKYKSPFYPSYTSGIPLRVSLLVRANILLS